MQRIILIVLAVAACVSCRSRRSANESFNISETIHFSEKTEKTIQNSVDSVAYLALEAVEKSLFGNADKMIARDGRIYIADYKRGRLIVFDVDGNFIFSINKLGRGPGEYLSLRGFTVDENYIYLTDFESNKLIKYTLSGEYVNEYALPVQAMDIGVFDNGDLILVSVPLHTGGFVTEQTPHRVFITDADLKIHTSLFGYEQEEIDPVGKLSYLSENELSIVFHTAGSDVVHVFSKADPKDMRHLLIDFGDSKIPDKHRSSLQKMDEGRYNYIYSTPVFAGKYLSLEVNLGDYYETFLYDTESRQLLYQAEDDTIVFPYPNCGSGGKYYTLLSGISQYRALVDGGFPEASAHVQSHLERDKTAMIVYTMKK